MKIAKINKNNKRVLILVGACCIAILAIGIVLIIRTSRERINWEAYEKVKPDIEAERFINALPEARRKAIFKELVRLQDKYTELYPYNNDNQQLAYKQIAERYRYSEKIIRKIALEGAKKGWIYEMKREEYLFNISCQFKKSNLLRRVEPW